MPFGILSRPGQIQGTGSADAQWLRIWSAEVLAQFQDYSTMRERVMRHELKEGKSMTFPAFGRASAQYHTPGDDMTGQVIKGAEREIFIDDILYSGLWIHKIDVRKAHFPFKEQYSRELAQALVRVYDSNQHQVAVLAARAATTVEGNNGGTRIVAATAKTDPAVFVDCLAQAQQAMDEKFVPKEGRSLMIAPALYQVLFKNDKLINRDYDVNGSLRKGTIGEIYGFEVVKSVHMPTTNITTGPTAYRGDFTTTAAVAFHESAVGTVELMSLELATEWWETRKSTWVDASLAVGHGILRPEASVEIATA